MVALDSAPALIPCSTETETDDTPTPISCITNDEDSLSTTTASGVLVFEMLATPTKTGMLGDSYAGVVGNAVDVALALALGVEVKVGAFVVAVVVVIVIVVVASGVDTALESGGGDGRGGLLDVV